MASERAPQTLFEKIWSKHRIMEREDGQVLLYIDNHLVQDGAAPAFEMLRRRGIATPPPVVSVAPGASSSATILEVRAHDAPGLLHRIGRALDAAGVRVRTAHVSTLGADAVDAFYVTDAEGRPLERARAAEVARSVQEALG